MDSRPARQPFPGARIHSIPLLFLLVLPLSVLAIGSTVSIESVADFATQRPCVTDCLYGFGPGDGSGSLGSFLKCGGPLLDSCFCRSDLQPTAKPWISTCASRFCSGEAIDVNNAVSLYTAYCATAGKDLPPTTTIAAASNEGGAGLKTLTVSRILVTSNGAVVTSAVAPGVTIINQNDPNFSQLVNLNLPGKSGVGGLRVDLLTETLALGTLLVVVALL